MSNSCMEMYMKHQNGTVDVQEVIRNARIPISEILIENYCHMVHISVALTGKEFSGWLIYDSDDLDEDDEDLEPMNIGITRFDHSEKRGDELTLYHENRLTGAFRVLRDIFHVFSGPLKHISLITGTVPRPSISQFLIDIYEHFDTLKQCPSMQLFEPDSSSTTMMDQILESATGLKKLDLRSRFPADWRNERITKIDTLLAWPAEWFTTTDLLVNMDCECANINDATLKWQSFKAFMLKWQMGGNTKLKVLEVSFDGNWEGFQLDGLEYKEWDKNERDSHYPEMFLPIGNDWMNCERACDIQRADGLLASFWRTTQAFHFVVWHDRHPIATLRPDPELLVKIPTELSSDEEDEEEEEEDDE